MTTAIFNKGSKVIPAEVCRARLENPCATLEEIGNKFDVTREAIRLILRQYNLPTKHLTTNSFICNDCGGEFKTKQNYSYINLHKYAPSFCPECRRKRYWITLICSECSKPFERRLGVIKASTEIRGYKGKGMFCSRQCYGKWFGENYGKGAQRKYDWDNILMLKRCHQWSGYRISKILGIPESAVYHILKKGQNDHRD